MPSFKCVPMREGCQFAPATAKCLWKRSIPTLTIVTREQRQASPNRSIARFEGEHSRIVLDGRGKLAQPMEQIG